MQRSIECHFKVICINILVYFSLDTHSESLTLALYLHTLVSFTSPNTWALLKVKSLMALKPGMSQLCSNVLGALVQKGFFITLRVRLNHLNHLCDTARHQNQTRSNESMLITFLANTFERYQPNAYHIETDLI